MDRFDNEIDLDFEIDFDGKCAKRTITSLATREGEAETCRMLANRFTSV